MAIDRNARTPVRIQRNWQNLIKGGSTGTISVTAPLQNTGSSIFLNLDAAGGLENNSGALRVKLAANPGINRTASGLSIQLNGASLTLGASGLSLSAGLGVLTTKGDLLVYTGSVNARQAVGTNGRALVADSTQTNGVAWASYAAGGVLFSHFADVGNGTTVETDLYSDSVAGNTLGTNGQALNAVYGLALVNSTSTKTMKVYFGGTVIFNSGALTTSAAGQYAIEATIVRDSATSVRYNVRAQGTGVNTTTATAIGTVTGLTLSGAVILKITGQAGGTGPATNDIVAKSSIVEFKGV